MKKSYVPVLVILSLLFLALAIYYWATPAGSIPSFIPGHEAASTHHHLKHGLAALVVAAGFAIWAWFASGSKPTHTTSAQNKETE